MSAGSLIDRERSAFAAHRAALRGSGLPPPHDAPKGTFLHGFFLPFSLILATMRDKELRGPYLRVVLLRGLLVALAAVVAIAGGSISGAKAESGPKPASGIVVHRSQHGGKHTKPVHVDMPGLHVNIDNNSGEAAVSVLGQQIPVTTVDTDQDPAATADEAAQAKRVDDGEQATGEATNGPPSFMRRVIDRARQSWAWLLALVAFLSAVEFVLVFFSRRWDDWMSFHASRLAAIVPEDETPKTPKIAFDLRWLYRKMKRRVRGYVVFAAGIPALLPLRLVATAGPWLFTIGLTVWGWYWLGVFSAAKSAHAWADEEQALSPAPIRTLNYGAPRNFVFAPIRWYGRLWARITRGVNPAATTFERTPAPFLGLALARVLLSLPGFYLLARPIVPVAAGRLCAEADPAARFSIPPSI